MSKTSDFTLGEAVSLLALFQSGSDGNFDDSELKEIQENQFFKQFNVIDNSQLFIDVLNTGNLNEIFTKELPNSFEGCELQFKEDLINAMLKIILADGEVEESEIGVLQFAGSIIGLTSEDVNRILQDETKRMQARNEELRAEIEAKKSEAASSSGGCFVATATMGNYDHPVVLDLRVFRHETLKKTIFGRLFVKFYYAFGPYPAALIAKSNNLRRLSFKYLIKPLHKWVSKD